MAKKKPARGHKAKSSSYSAYMTSGKSADSKTGAKRETRSGKPKRTAEAFGGSRTLPVPPVSGNLPRGPQALANRCVGILRESGFDGIVEPDPGYNTAQYGRILVRSRNLNGAPFGMKVVCEILNPTAQAASYEGSILEVLGDPGRSDVAILSILKQYGLSPSFPEAVSAESEKFPIHPSGDEILKAIAAGRRDLRTLRTITMDGEDAKDLDDAISIEKIEGKGYRLFVHIADVSEYVRENTALDREARQRGTSVYLVDRVIPMLPPRLSNGLCSLNPNVPRFALTAAMTVGFDGEVIDGDLYESMIESDARTSYKEVYGVLFENQYMDRYASFVPMFKTMKELKDILTEKRTRRGSIEFDFPETHVDLDAEGNPTNIYAYPINYANGIIEEFMILCNEFVAERFYRMKYPFVYRVHEDPDDLKIGEFLHVAKLFGAQARTHGKPTPLFLSGLMNQIKDEPFTPALSQILLRSLAKARYSEQNLGHFGLASECYCHFTSPIRRYPDLYIHRIIKSYLHDEGKKAHFASQVIDVSDHSSQMERNSMEAERASVNQKIAEYMTRHVGDLFDGIISSVFHGGIFVRLESTVEGLVPFRTMNDYFEFDERRLEAKGKTSGQVYRIGDPVKVKVVNADILQRRVDFELAETISGGKRGTREKADIKKDAGKGIEKHRKIDGSKPGRKSRKEGRR